MPGGDSYKSWEYSVEYSKLPSEPMITIVTFDSSVHLTGLTSGALYELDIVARGLSDLGAARLSVPIVFHTRTDCE